MVRLSFITDSPHAWPEPRSVMQGNWTTATKPIHLNVVAMGNEFFKRDFCNLKKKISKLNTSMMGPTETRTKDFKTSLKMMISLLQLDKNDKPCYLYSLMPTSNLSQYQNLLYSYCDITWLVDGLILMLGFYWKMFIFTLLETFKLFSKPLMLVETASAVNYIRQMQIITHSNA